MTDSIDRKTEELPKDSEIILVVDDETELLELAKESLESLSYHVLTASNGKEALERLADHITVVQRYGHAGWDKWL
jgi:response regulator RpfG family c-di-GMP phosphodiesterase